ncbi:MAG: methyl-accepting chemotaxis protein [Treponema sp.]|nr:methyl-accepting chemotaxis protein [Treponema sp.]
MIFVGILIIDITLLGISSLVLPDSFLRTALLIVLSVGGIALTVYLRHILRLNLSGRLLNAAQAPDSNRTVATLLPLEKLEKIAVNLNKTGKNISETVHTSLDIAEDIDATVLSLVSKAIYHGVEVSDIRKSTEHITAHIEALDALIQSQSTAVTESSAAIGEMTSNIKSVSGILNKNTAFIDTLCAESETGKGKIAQIVAIMKILVDDSVGLSEATVMIQTMALQMKLLAMNAAVEAAHAGEYGKGFAIVAEEMRTLADNTSIHGKNINKVLKQLKKEINETASLSSGAQKQFNHVIKLITAVREQEDVIQQAMNEQASGSEQILRAVGQVQTITAQVHEDSNAIKKSGLYMRNTITYLDEETAAISKDVNQIMGYCEDLNGFLHTINSHVLQMKDTVSGMSALIV